MIEATLDKSEKKQGLYEFLKEIAAYYNISDMERIKKASKNAWKVYNNFNVMRRSGVSYKNSNLSYHSRVEMLTSASDTPPQVTNSSLHAPLPSI